MTEQHEHEHDPVAGEIVHVYDDIREADNRLPRWWLATFYGSIAFAGLYWFYYHEYDIGLNPLDAYNAHVAQAAATSGQPLSDEQLDAMAHDGTTVAAGRQVFAQNCVVCHGERGEGKIGPNLTDNLWIHGGAPTNVWATVKDGVAAKGMPQWGTVLGALPTQQVSAYVLSLRNTNVPGKAAEGTPYSPAAAAAPAANTAAAPEGSANAAAAAPIGATDNAEH